MIKGLKYLVLEPRIQPDAFAVEDFSGHNRFCGILGVGKTTLGTLACGIACFSYLPSTATEQRSLAAAAMMHRLGPLRRYVCASCSRGYEAVLMNRGYNNIRQHQRHQPTKESHSRHELFVCLNLR